MLSPRSHRAALLVALPLAVIGVALKGFSMCSFQAQQDSAASRTAELPPLQSIMELTTAWKPPSRGAQVGRRALLLQEGHAAVGGVMGLMRHRAVVA